MGNTRLLPTANFPLADLRAVGLSLGNRQLAIGNWQFLGGLGGLGG
jgi:hypothetical protein